MTSIHVGQVHSLLRVGLFVEAMGDVHMVESVDDSSKPKIIHVRSIRSKQQNAFQMKDLTGVMLSIRHESEPAPTPPPPPPPPPPLQATPPVQKPVPVFNKHELAKAVVLPTKSPSIEQLPKE